jgi:CDP-diacylglycerol--glycerol-3-phosphate 3-phosphatidyltransferase
MEQPLHGMPGAHSSPMNTLPNKLTLLRIACTPVMVLLLFFLARTASSGAYGKSLSFLAAFLFGLASVTDLLDGFLARRRKMVTNFGKHFDPLADKLLVSATLIMLIPLGRVEAWMVLVIIGREIAVTGLRGIASSEGVILTPTEMSKKKMVFQIVAILGLLLHYEYFGIDFHGIGMFFMWLAVAVTLWSGIMYFRKFWYVLDREDIHIRSDE